MAGIVSLRSGAEKSWRCPWRQQSDEGLRASHKQVQRRPRDAVETVSCDAVKGYEIIMLWLESIWQDLRHGAVLLRRDAGTSGLAVLVLALGIGGNAAVFTLLKAAFLDPLPYRDAGRLVTVVGRDGWHPKVSEFFEIHDRSRTLDQLAFVEHQDMQLSGTDEPERVYAARVSASFFSLLGTNTSLGRTFRPEENQAGHADRSCGRAPAGINSLYTRYTLPTIG
jgi:MacB-like periplasmic core domain